MVRPLHDSGWSPPWRCSRLSGAARRPCCLGARHWRRCATAAVSSTPLESLLTTPEPSCCWRPHHGPSAPWLAPKSGLDGALLLCASERSAARALCGRALRRLLAPPGVPACVSSAVPWAGTTGSSAVASAAVAALPSETSSLLSERRRFCFGEISVSAFGGVGAITARIGSVSTSISVSAVEAAAAVAP